MQTRPRPKRYRKTNRRAKPVREGKPNLNLEPHQIVLRPIVTEKGTHQSERYNSFCFEVHSAANKTQIRSAIESLFPVRVTTVRTQVRMGKEKRFRGAAGKQPDWKKAVVTLHPDDKIEFF
ncbi:MAG: 50S ribosomal protein L23 [Gemmataceae bacterium]|nr:50S ribosomal protein L23 [Gemmataceae bacterium]